MSMERLQILIKQLHFGVGHDGIHSVFLQYGSVEFLSNIVKLINSCYSHCYIPVEMMKGKVTPIIKDVKGNAVDFSNYRPVMVSSSILKILELHVLDILKEKVNLCHSAHLGHLVVCWNVLFGV